MNKILVFVRSLAAVLALLIIGQTGNAFAAQQKRVALLVGPTQDRFIGTWAKSELPPGQTLREPAPLFKKLDESLIEEE